MNAPMTIKQEIDQSIEQAIKALDSFVEYVAEDAVQAAITRNWNNTDGKNYKRRAQFLPAIPWEPSIAVDNSGKHIV